MLTLRSARRGDRRPRRGGTAGDQLVQRPDAPLPRPRERAGRRGRHAVSDSCQRSVTATAASTSASASGVGERGDGRAVERRQVARRATTTSSSPTASSAVRTPPAGPSTGKRSATTGRPKRASSTRSPPTSTTGSHPPASSGRRHALDHRHAVDLDERLVGAHPAAARRRSSTAPGGHDPARGGPSGSSCTRNVATRSASSVSPIAAAIAPSPASARRNPRFVGSDQRT